MRTLVSVLLVLPLALTLSCGDSARLNTEPSASADAAPVGSVDSLDSDSRVEATSLLGRPLIPAKPTAEFQATHEGFLIEARTQHEADPDDPDALIWMGRRTAYLGRYREAIEIYTRGIKQHPGDARFYRHRGHRYLTTRQLDLAERDLAQAVRLTHGQPDQIEPDGLPNARGIPTSTLKSNTWYHLGLTHYLKGDFSTALAAYRECLEVSNNPDMLVATTYWLYMTLRRLGEPEAAEQALHPISAEMDIIENDSYHQLLLLYKEGDPGTADRRARDLLTDSSSDTGEIAFPTTSYGVGNWHLFNNRPDRAREIFEKILESEAWAAFGYLAAEAELAREQER